MIWPYSEVETAGIVSQIALKVFGSNLNQEPTFLARGSNNAVYRVETPFGPAVVRVTGEWREITTRREQWCYEQAQRLGIPGPTVLAVGRVEKLPYIAMSFVEGESNLQTFDIWQALGRYGALVNSVEITDEALDLYRKEEEPWPAQIDEIIDTWFVGETHFPAEESEVLVAALRKIQNLPVRLGLSHGDLDPRNTIVSPTGEINLIDWCCSRIGLVPHVDLYNVLREHTPIGPELTAYLQGFGMSGQDFEKILPEVRIFGMTELFSGVGWAKRGRPDLFEIRLSELRQAITLHLDSIRTWLDV